MVATCPRIDVMAGRGGVDAIGEENDVALAGGIDPDGRAGEAGVAEGTDGEQFAAIARRAANRCPSRGRAEWADRAGSAARELLDGEGTDDADAIELAAIEHHLGEAGEVVGGGEESGVSGDAAHVAGGGVVDHAAERRAGLACPLGGGDAGYESGGGGNVVSVMPRG